MSRPVVVRRTDLYPAEACAAAMLRKARDRARRDLIRQQAHADVQRALADLTDVEAQTYRRAALAALMGAHVWQAEGRPGSALSAEIDRIFGVSP